jgi:hypothetical protein
MIESCRHYEGSISLRSFVRFRYRQVLGWDQAMASALFARLPGNDIATTIMDVFGPRRKALESMRFLIRATMSRSIPLSTAAMFLQAWALEPFARIPRPDQEPDDADRHYDGMHETSVSAGSEA